MKPCKSAFLLSVLLILSGCVGTSHPKGDCKFFYPELPDNEYCFRKIAEYNAFIQNPANRERTECKTEDGKTHVYNMVFPETSPEGYLGILVGRGVVREYTICLDKTHYRELWKKFEFSLPDCLLWVKGGCEMVELKDYFNFRDETHLATVTFYYKSSDQEKFQAWLRKNVPVKELSRRSVKEK